MSQHLNRRPMVSCAPVPRRRARSVSIFLLAPLFLAGCAVGFGEEASGEVVVSLAPEGTDSGGVRFEEASLHLLDVHAVREERDEDEGGHGHGHAHLERAPGIAEDDRAEEFLRFPVGAALPTRVDLLGGEQHLATFELTAGGYEGLVLQAVEDAGCSLFAQGLLIDEEIPVSICLSNFDLSIPVHFHVGRDERAILRLPVHVEDILAGIDLLGLTRGDDGSIRIDGRSNAVAAALIEENLQRAFPIHDEAHEE